MSETLVDSSQIDASKRTWLIASSCAGAIGGAAVVVPFVSSFQPSEKAKAAGAAVEADISALKPGEKMTVEWRGKPVWILRRTPEQLAALPKLNAQLADPKSERKPAEQAPEYAPVDHGLLAPELRELERLLANNMLAARRQLDQIEPLLVNTALELPFEPVAQATRKLKFKAAQAALGHFSAMLVAKTH